MEEKQHYFKDRVLDTEEMKEVQDKASVLVEALPYIQRFNRKIIVIKYGGSAMVDPELKKEVIRDVTLLKLVGFKPIIVPPGRGRAGLHRRSPEDGRPFHGSGRDGPEPDQ